MARALRRLLVAASLALACAAPRLSSRGGGPQALAPLPTPTPPPTPTPAPSFPQRQPLDEQLPVKVRSRSLRYDNVGQRTVFYGGVTVTHDSSTLQAQELRSSDQGRNAEALGGVRLLDPRRRLDLVAGRILYGDALRQGELYDGVRLATVSPYGQPLTVSGRQGGYLGLSRSAWLDGDVLLLRLGLTVSAHRAELEEDGAIARLLGGVDVRLGLNRAQADGAELQRDGQSLSLSGHVRARFTPDELRRASEAPWSAGQAGPQTKEQP